MTEKLSRGRPPLFKSPDEMLERGLEYLRLNPSRPLISGMADYLGTSRQSLWNYEQKPEYADIIQYLKNRVEMVHEARLFEDSCTGSMFFLKGYMKMSDRHDLNISGEMITKVERVVLKREVDGDATD